MFDMKDFFKQDPSHKPSRQSEFMGQIGKYGLHAVKFMALMYTSYHGISASLQYSGGSVFGAGAQIIGVLVTSTTAMSIWIAWHNHKITGTKQSFAAVFTWLFCIGLEAMAVLADSQLHLFALTKETLPDYLLTYMMWVLPLSPIVSLLGAVSISESDPAQFRARKQAAEWDEVIEAEFDAHITAQRVRMESEKMLANMQLNAQQSAAKQIVAWAQGPEAQEALTQAARKNAPALFRSIGVNLDHLMPGVIEGTLVHAEEKEAKPTLKTAPPTHADPIQATVEEFMEVAQQQVVIEEEPPTSEPKAEPEPEVIILPRPEVGVRAPFSSALYPPPPVANGIRPTPISGETGRPLV